MKRTSVRMAIAAAACGLLAQNAAFGADEPIGLTRPVHATSADLDPGRLYSSPAFAVDPEDSMRVVAGFADLRTRRCGLMRSTDGGSTWSLLESSPAMPSYPFCSQSQGGVVQAPVAFGRNGTLYMALGGWDDQDGSRAAGAILLARSTNLGDSWQTTIVYNARGKTDPSENPRPVNHLAVDRFSGSDDTVYVTFNAVRTSPSAPNAVVTSPMVAVSSDGGRTFGEPADLAAGVFEAPALREQALSAVTTTTLAPNATAPTTTVPPAGSKAAQPNQAANFGGTSSRSSMQAGVDGEGKAYVVWHSGTVNITPSPPSARFISTSTDGGRTWATAQTTPFDYDVETRPRMAVSEDGVIHLVYGSNPTPDISGNGEIYHQASTDDGKTWSEPIAITDDDPAALVGQYHPYVSVAPNGRVDAVWWDTRSDPGIRSNDVYYAYSSDNGRTWSKNFRVTDQSVDRRVGVWGANYDISSPPAVASTNAYALFGWDDTRNTSQFYGENVTSEFGGGLQDIFTAQFQFEVVGGGTSNAARIALAGVIGLVVVGLVLLAVAVGAKRRSTTPSQPTTTVGDRPDAKVV